MNAQGAPLRHAAEPKIFKPGFNSGPVPKSYNRKYVKYAATAQAKSTPPAVARNHLLREIRSNPLAASIATHGVAPSIYDAFAQHKSAASHTHIGWRR